MPEAECGADAAYHAFRIEDFPKGLQPREMPKNAGPRQVGEDVLLEE